jgi:asparagine synthase (glutamine-hydrolysing)
MISDVPLGAFLSGGVDSSTIVALMQSQSKDPVKTFTIGFDEGAFNEANHAKIVARHIGTDHTEHYVSPEETLDVIPGLPFLWDEPFGDSSQIPTFLISRLARQKVTVSLSGDGGDELFAGYNRYVWAEALHRKLKFLPGLSRTLLGSLISIIPPRKWDSFFGFIAPINKSLFEHTLPGDKIHKLAEIIKQSRNENLYLALVSQWHDPDSVVLGGKEPSTPLNEIKTLVSKDLVPRMQYLDMVTYLPDDILVKVDRAAMGVSLESRVPFLDHRVVEFAARIPLSYKIHGKKGKKILRNVLYKYVPKRLIERPKMGFGVPVRDWLRGPLLDWANDLLSQKRLLSDGYFNPDPIQRKWQEHLSGSRNWEGQIWTILMFQSWLEKQ